MELYIDTTRHGQILVQLLDGGRVVARSEKRTEKISESLLGQIERLLVKSKVRFFELSKISVNLGPGGFSSTRSGVATANTLNFVLGVPRLVLPKYDKEPNITKPKV